MMRLCISFVFFLLFPMFCFSMEPEHFLSICTFLPEEKIAIKPWIEYHKSLGVNHFFFYYSKTSSVNKNQLQDYVQKGEAELIFWPDISAQLDWISITKLSAYENACQHLAKNHTKWLVFLEANEFLVLADASLEQLLEKYDGAPAITLSPFYYENRSYSLSPTKTKRLIAPNKKQSAIEKTIFQPRFVKNTSLAPYRHQFTHKKAVIKVPKNSLRVHCYFPGEKDAIYTSQIFCDPVDTSFKELREAKALGYEMVDTSSVNELFSEKINKYSEQKP